MRVHTHLSHLATVHGRYITVVLYTIPSRTGQCSPSLSCTTFGHRGKCGRHAAAVRTVGRDVTYYLKTFASSAGVSTNSMEQSPFWKANRFSAGQEIPRILRIATCPCPEPDQSIPYFRIPLLEDQFWH
jgi:hypothetical protein